MISTLGRYKIISEIGQGAMGVVYKAVDPIIDRTVAIKTINLNLSKQELEEYEQRFQQEIKAAGRLNHPKITDFGIARLPNSAVKTMTGLILGSPRYMSPEQVIGKTIDARSDIFSLGVVLYEALTGVAPFDGDNVNAIMYATVNTTPPPPSQHNRTVPAMLDLIVAKAMAKLLEDRYQTIKELADDLREVRRQIDSVRPASALRATSAPPQPRPTSSAPLLQHEVDTAT